mmetsp:Transcript_23170/g.46285  ORF Transcript_23170/g.46285 Transcript_23170/m.46285 type:complete len:113 (-) Transcript_23170:35-373(-)
MASHSIKFPIYLPKITLRNYAKRLSSKSLPRKSKYPYYVQCDDGSQLKIPKDHDLCIQKMHEQFVAVLGPDGKPLNQIPDLPAKDHAAELRQEALFKESPPEKQISLLRPMR